MKKRVSLARAYDEIRRVAPGAITLGLCLLLVVGGIGCKPRGESKSLQEIVLTAQRRYRKALDGTSFPQKVEGLLKSVSGDLETLLAGGGDKKQTIGAVVENLQSLTTAAGYTSRPALGELIDQFSAFKAQTTIDEDSLALVVARTFFLLASELEGVRFQLYERELKK